MSIENIEKPIYDKDYTYTFSILLFILTIALTIGLYVFNFNLNREINNLNNSISNIKNSVAEIRKDPKIQVYELLEANKRSIKTLENKSRVESYIQEMKRIMTGYEVDFTGFDYNYGKLKTIVNSSSVEDGKLAYEKTIDFIDRYRKTDKESIFDMPFINTIDGQSSMKFEVIFNVNFEKMNKIKLLENEKKKVLMKVTGKTKNEK